MSEDPRRARGWYLAERNWDLIIVVDGILLAAIEFKSQIGPSFGNNPRRAPSRCKGF